MSILSIDLHSSQSAIRLSFHFQNVTYIRRLTGGMRCRVEAVIQAQGGYTRYWTIDVVKWFISDVLKVKWQSYRALWTTGCNPPVLGWRPQPCVSSLQLDVGCPVVIAAAIPDAMLLPTDECFAQGGSRWSVHQRRLATSCCPPFRQRPTSYKACVYGWQRQASSCKSNNRLPPKRSRDFCSSASTFFYPIEHNWDMLG
jgi:hypothetical protein